MSLEELQALQNDPSAPPVTIYWANESYLPSDDAFAWVINEGSPEFHGLGINRIFDKIQWDVLRALGEEYKIKDNGRGNRQGCFGYSSSQNTSRDAGDHNDLGVAFPRKRDGTERFTEFFVAVSEVATKMGVKWAQKSEVEKDDLLQKLWEKFAGQISEDNFLEGLTYAEMFLNYLERLKKHHDVHNCHMRSDIVVLSFSHQDQNGEWLRQALIGYCRKSCLEAILRRDETVGPFVRKVLDFWEELPEHRRMESLQSYFDISAQMGTCFLTLTKNQGSSFRWPWAQGRRLTNSPPGCPQQLAPFLTFTRSVGSQSGSLLSSSSLSPTVIAHLDTQPY